MQDRWAMVDLLTKRPTPTSMPFITAALKNASNQYLRQILDNLTGVSFDNQDIVADAINIAKTHRSNFTRETAIRLLAKQVTSKDLVCPELVTISAKPATVPDMELGVRSAAERAIAALGCSVL
jgi:hypothetical protein